MSDLEQRVKALETKVKILEETLETLKNMQLSEQMEAFIGQKKQALKMANLINAISGKSTLDFCKEEESIINLSYAKRNVDNQIQKALRDVGTFSEQFPDDPRYFDYEEETGLVSYFEYTDNSSWTVRDKRRQCQELQRYVKKGLRIVGYNGFDTQRIVVPSEIDGRPVISIGEKAFMNATFSELLLPSSLKAILREAFKGCKNLRYIDLPEGLEYLGEECFSETGLESIRIPNLIKGIPWSCFKHCKDIENIVLGNRIREMQAYAFCGCSKLNQITLPESVEIIENCFEGTAIKTLIIPSSVSKISYKPFGDNVRNGVNNIVCVFLGKDTVIEGGWTFYHVGQIYCLPGSNVQKFAREHSIPMKPLSEFDLESI